MAQRISLIPVSPSIVANVTKLVCRMPEHSDDAWKKLRAQCIQHRRITLLSRSFAAGVEELAMPKGGTASYEAVTATRPYFVTVADPIEAAAKVIEISECAKDDDAFGIFQEEAKRLGEGWRGRKVDSATEGDPDGRMWQDLRVTAGRLRAMRHCYREQISYSAATLQKLGTLPEFRSWSLSESDSMDIAWGKIPAVYGAMLGAFCGQLMGLAEPVWGMSGGCWVGQLATMKLSMMDRMKAGKTQDEIARLGRTPAEMLRDASLPAFEAGFDKTGATGSTGLYFPVTSVVSLLESLQCRRPIWESMTKTAIGNKPDEIPAFVRSVEEALIWAKTANRALMEGEEPARG